MAATPYPALTELPGTSFPVYVSDGTEERARQIAERCRSARHFLGVTFDFELQLRVLVLNPEHWREYATFPVYGMPHYTDAQTLAVAGEDNDFWQSMAPPVDALLPQAAEVMRAAYGQTDGSIDLSLFFDLLAVHEMGHLCHLQASLQFPRRWLMELFCNICLHAYVVAREPQKVLALEAFPSVIAGGEVSQLRYRSLADFERLYTDVGPHNYGWYQCRFHVAAKDIYNAGGVEALKRLWKVFLISNEELAVQLRDDVHPAVARVLTEWAG
jgi:hypothetical protein